MVTITGIPLMIHYTDQVVCDRCKQEFNCAHVTAHKDGNVVEANVCCDCLEDLIFDSGGGEPWSEVLKRADRERSS